MKTKIVTLAPLAKDVDAFATKQAPAAGGMIIMSSGAALDNDADRDAFCAAQTPTAAGSLTMNGVLANQQLTYPRVVTIYCTSDISADTYTIRGWTASEPGRVQTETLVGPNAGTVRSTKVYSAVKGIETDTAATSVVEVGQQAVGLPTSPVRVFFTASVDESAGTYTVYGLDINGKYTTESGAMPTVNGAVVTTNNFTAVLGISLASACATTISVGTASKCETKWYQVDRDARQTMVEIEMSGTADFDYTIQYTNKDIHATTFTPTVAGSTSSTATDVSDYNVFPHPVSAVRLSIDSFVSGTANMIITQQRESY